MSKMKIDPEMCMKTKDKITICPTQKATFLPGCTPLYTEKHVFCGHCRLFCQCSSTGERTLRFKMWKIEGRHLTDKLAARASNWPPPNCAGCLAAHETGATRRGEENWENPGEPG